MINKVPKIPTFILLLVVGIICDVVVKKGTTLVYVENWNGFIIAAIQIQGTIVTLAIALLSLLSSIFKEKYFGVRVIDYVLFVDDNFTDLTKFMECEVIFVILNIILYILGVYNTILFIAIYSVYIVIYFIKRICLIFKPIIEIESKIKNYLEKSYFIDISLRNNLYQHIKELIVNNNHLELKEYLDFIIVLFKKMNITIDGNKMDELFDELADCMQECFISDDVRINILGTEIVLKIINLQKVLITSKINIKKDIFEKLIDILSKDKEQFITIEGGMHTLLYGLPKNSLEIKKIKLNDENKSLSTNIYSYYISKYMKNTKLFEEEATDALSDVFEDYVREFHGYEINELIKKVSFEVICSLLLSLYDKNWPKCYELLFINKYICSNIYYDRPEECMIVLVQIFYLYMNRFYNKLDNEHIVNDSFDKIYRKHIIKISKVLYNIVEKASILFTYDYAKMIYNLLVSRIMYFNNGFTANDVKEFFIMLLYIVDTDDRKVSDICNNLMAGDYFVMYHHMFDNRGITKQKFDYICSLLSERIIYNVRDKELYSKFSRKIDMLYSNHRLEQKKEYYDNSITAISNFKSNLNVYIKQYVKDLIKSFDTVDTAKQSVSIEEEQTLVDLSVEIMSNAEYIFGAVEEYIKNHVVNMLENSIKDYIGVRYEKISEDNVKNYLNAIENNELLIGNENFQYWELDKIQDEISNKINKTNSIILWTDDDETYLTKIVLNKLRVTFDDVTVSVRDYSEEEMIKKCKTDNNEYIVEMDTGIRVSLTKEKMIEYFKYSRKIVEVKYIFKYQIIDTNDIAEKTIFNIDK